MTDKLTIKQENFCTAYVETGNASEAYRMAYNASGMKDTSINVKACELLKNGKVTVRLEELRTGHADRHEVTIQSLNDELYQAQEMARAEGNPTAFIAAVKLRAQLYGFLTDKKEVKQRVSIEATPSFREFFASLPIDVSKG